MPDYYTPKEAAPLLGLHPHSVRTFIQRGMIAAVKENGRYLISAEEIERYNRERRGVGGPKGRTLSAETKQKLREQRVGEKNPFHGRKHSPESLAKMSLTHMQQPRGEDSHAWKGGRVFDTNGYVLIYAPDHPAVVNRYVPEHRLVMEQVLGRYLESYEEVHHKNGVITDNRPENLEVLTKSEHSRFHRLNPHIRKKRSM